MTDIRMTNQEAVMLCRLAKAACPQQQFDQYTPDMWHELLGDLRYEDAKAALIDVVKAQPFVSPAEIRDRVRKVRGQRLDAYGYICPPHDLEGIPALENAWIKEMVRRIGDGDVVPGQIPAVAELVEREVPDWQALMPAMPRMSFPEVAAKGAQRPERPARRGDPEYRDRLDSARAELEQVRVVGASSGGKENT